MTTLDETILDCGHKPSPHSEHTTGYGEYQGKTYCWDCCAKFDCEQMINEGKITLYLTHHTDGKQHGNFPFATQPLKPLWTVSNWPGTLRISAYVRKGRHNIAGTRYDAWFTGPDNKQWHGVLYGENTQLCHCKRLKSSQVA